MQLYSFGFDEQHELVDVGDIVYIRNKAVRIHSIERVDITNKTIWFLGIKQSNFQKSETTEGDD